MTIPRICTPRSRYFSWIVRSAGISSRHGTHQVAQKTTWTTCFPRSSFSVCFWLFRSLSVKSCARSPTRFPASGPRVGIFCARRGAAGRRRLARAPPARRLRSRGRRRMALRGNLSQDRIDLLDQLVFRHVPQQLVLNLPSLEEQDGRDRHDAVPDGGGLRLVDVEVRHLQAAVVLLRDRLDDRLQPLAGRAPLRGKIQENRDGRAQDLVLEIAVVHLDHAPQGASPQLVTRTLIIPSLRPDERWCGCCRQPGRDGCGPRPRTARAGSRPPPPGGPRADAAPREPRCASIAALPRPRS